MMRKHIKNFLTLMLSITLLAFAPSTKSFAVTDNSENSSTSSSSYKLDNNYPIVMVHGLFGWGNDELFGINYWGGHNSLKDLLTEKGYTVFTPTIGSISSNWDRACELYAYLKGGTVDYGEEHSNKAGHSRYGRTYPGVYPELGTEGKNGLKKIHLIGHSMGGETIRALAQLLENGDPDEIKHNTTDISPLLAGNHHWIESITTIATPHDGSQEDEKKDTLEPHYHKFFAAIAAATGVTHSDNPCFDFRMDQWGLKKQSYESFDSYVHRVFNSNLWKQTKDLSIWDLSQEGAKELNSWVKAQSDIYYFSISCLDTHEDPLTKHQIPNINMDPLLLKSSTFMGQYTTTTGAQVKVDSSWWPNDGIVSVISAIAPHQGSKDKIVNYDPDSTPEKGVWNYMGVIDDVDHIEVVSQDNPIYREVLQDKFIDLAKMLNQLPS
jgi:triacylglycerol esterase/lipase EstA (alpha/beta hydrolase family)